ncbi:hypothetical protein JX266_002202 [Neoarthrinium moseri]|nr:hypothetical protein JX266_002202 [Neoarthrinium moseri]
MEQVAFDNGTIPIGSDGIMPGDLADDEYGEFDSSPDFISQYSQRYSPNSFFTPTQMPGTGSDASSHSMTGNSVQTISPSDAIWSPLNSHPGHAVLSGTFPPQAHEYLDRILVAQQHSRALLQETFQHDDGQEHQQPDDSAYPTPHEANQDEPVSTTTDTPEPFTSYGQFVDIPDVEYGDLFPELDI